MVMLMGVGGVEERRATGALSDRRLDPLTADVEHSHSFNRSEHILLRLVRSEPLYSPLLQSEPLYPPLLWSEPLYSPLLQSEPLYSPLLWSEPLCSPLLRSGESALCCSFALVESSLNWSSRLGSGLLSGPGCYRSSSPVQTRSRRSVSQQPSVEPLVWRWEGGRV